MEIFKLMGFAVKSYAVSVIGFLQDPVAWIFVFITYSLYKRTTGIQKVMYGKKLKYPISELVATSVLFGLIAGLIGTIITTVMGITFYELSGIMFLIITSLLLMLINPRYVCLSYSGGLWSLIVLIITDLVDKGILSKSNFIYSNLKFDVTALMAVVAVLHLMEAMLMWFDGHRGALPVFIKREGRVVGAFVMQKFWIIPAIIYIFSQAAPGGADTLATPSWWPLIKPGLSENILKDALFLAAPLIAMLGYGDIAISSDVREKVKRSSTSLFAFSNALLALSIISSNYHVFKYIAAIFAPVAHELLIYIENAREKSGKPLWQYKDDGIIVLDTIPDSPSEAMGLLPGELLVNINNTRVKSMEEAEELLKTFPTYIWVELITRSGKKRTVEYKDYVNGVRNLGIITVPPSDFGLPVIENREGFLKRYFKNRGK
jgi:hypothetical protein